MLAAKSFSVSDETERLDHLKNTWLEAPYEQQRKSPALIIDWERRRIPMAVSPTEAIVDEDCPICQAMAEDLETPMFWGLDTAHFDDRFEFSSFETREEWEEEQRRQEFFNREFDRKWKDREKAALVEC